MSCVLFIFGGCWHKTQHNVYVTLVNCLNCFAETKWNRDSSRWLVIWKAESEESERKCIERTTPLRKCWIQIVAKSFTLRMVRMRFMNPIQAMRRTTTWSQRWDVARGKSYLVPKKLLNMVNFLLIQFILLSFSWDSLLSLFESLLFAGDSFCFWFNGSLSLRFILPSHLLRAIPFWSNERDTNWWLWFRIRRLQRLQWQAPFHVDFSFPLDISFSQSDDGQIKALSNFTSQNYRPFGAVNQSNSRKCNCFSKIIKWRALNRTGRALDSGQTFSVRIFIGKKRKFRFEEVKRKTGNFKLPFDRTHRSRKTEIACYFPRHSSH